MRGKTVEIVIATAVLACFVVIAWLDYSRQTQAVAEYDSFSSFDYQRGGYRAWFDLLRREGINAVRYERRPAYLDDSITAFIVANNLFDAELRIELGQAAGIYSEADYSSLAKWVESGGRLIWFVDQANATNTVLYSLRRVTAGGGETGLELPSIVHAKSSKDSAIPITASPFTDGVGAVSGTSYLRIPFGKNFNLTPLVADSTGAVVGWYRLGKGAVIVISDESLFENGRLGRAGNARLAYDLVAAGLPPRGAVAFEEWSHGYQAGDTWWAIMPRPFRLALIIGGVALLVGLVGLAWRFGPPAELPSDTERTSHEYLVSMAGLMERGGAARKAVRDLARLSLHAAARSVGLPDATPASAIAARLRGGEAGERRANDVITLDRLAGYEKPTPAELLRAAVLANDIRKEFISNGIQSFQPRRAAARRSA